MKTIEALQPNILHQNHNIFCGKTKVKNKLVDNRNTDKNILVHQVLDNLQFITSKFDITSIKTDNHVP